MEVAVIQFGPGSSGLDGDDLAVLRDVVRMHKRMGGLVRIFAHASFDVRSSNPQLAQAGNLDVSLRRGTSVVNALLRLGVPAEAMTMEALSDADPIYTTATASGIAANRRAEIFLDF
jgi:outer membrane protein OmpA-like peptidoglycan-associated protein